MGFRRWGTRSFRRWGESTSTEVGTLDAVTDRGATTSNALTTGTLTPDASTDDIGTAAAPWDDGFFGGAVLAGGASESDGAATINDFVGGDVSADEHGITLLTSRYADFGATNSAGNRDACWRFDTSTNTAGLYLNGSAHFWFRTTDMYPHANNVKDIGTTGKRFKNVFWSGAIYLGPASGAVTISYGTGTPEGAVTAPVSSLYLRSDGGAGASLYVKESGTGNTGWVGK